MKKINLSDNHRRSVSASIYMVERIVTELEQEIMSATNLVMSKVIRGEDEPDLQHYALVISQIKSQVHDLFTKYNLHPTEVYLYQVINSKKSAMWEILCDTTSRRLKGYGEFPKEITEEFDKDIDALQKLIASI